MRGARRCRFPPGWSDCSGGTPPAWCPGSGVAYQGLGELPRPGPGPAGAHLRPWMHGSLLLSWTPTAPQPPWQRRRGCQTWREPGSPALGVKQSRAQALVRHPWVPTLALSPSSYVTLGKTPPLSEPHFSRLHNAMPKECTQHTVGETAWKQMSESSVSQASGICTPSFLCQPFPQTPVYRYSERLCPHYKWKTDILCCKEKLPLK